MKMRKRILGTILAVTLVASQSVCVFAAGSKGASAGVSRPSKTATATTSRPSKGTTPSKSTTANTAAAWYKFDTVKSENLKDIPDDKMPQDAKDIQQLLFDGKISEAIEAIKKANPEVAKKLEGYTDVLTVQKVTILDTQKKGTDGKYELGISVPNKTADTDAIVLNYCFEKQEWEVSELTGTDNENLTMKVSGEGLATILAKKK